MPSELTEELKSELLKIVSQANTDQTKEIKENINQIIERIEDKISKANKEIQDL